MNLRCFATASLLAILGLTASARAALQIEEQTGDNNGQLTIFKMTVTPAAEPEPALKHRLILREIDEKAGDASSMYYRAILASQNVTKQLKDKYGDAFEDAIGDWSHGDVPVDKIRDAAAIIEQSAVISNLREAARRRTCDWGFEAQSISGPDLYMFLLPEMQESRQLSRFLAGRARVAIADGRYDDALETLRINVKMARDVAVEPFLVCGLVGVAEAGIGENVMIHLIAAPNSPNLYWALTELPDPLIDMRPGVRFEMSSFQRIFPFLHDPETQEHSPEEWAHLLAHGITDMAPISGGPVFHNETLSQAAVAGLGLATYSSAKARLVAAGWDAQRVEQMPVGQVIAIDSSHEYRRIADQLEKQWYLPYHVQDRDADRTMLEFSSNKLERGYGRLLAAILLPAVNSARTAQQRLQWQTDGLRTVEAIRMHAAKTGALPARLEDIDVVPAPVNRATGKLYQYQLKGDTAVLELPFSDGFQGVAWRFEIKLAK